MNISVRDHHTNNHDTLTHYCLMGPFVPVLLKFRFSKKKGLSKTFPMSVAAMNR